MTGQNPSPDSWPDGCPARTFLAGRPAPRGAARSPGHPALETRCGSCPWPLDPARSFKKIRGTSRLRAGTRLFPHSPEPSRDTKAPPPGPQTTPRPAILALGTIISPNGRGNALGAGGNALLLAERGGSPVGRPPLTDSNLAGGLPALQRPPPHPRPHHTEDMASMNTANQRKGATITSLLLPHSPPSSQAAAAQMSRDGAISGPHTPARPSFFAPGTRTRPKGR